MLKFRKYEALLRSGFIIIKTQLYFKYFIIYMNDNIYIYIFTKLRVIYLQSLHERINIYKNDNIFTRTKKNLQQIN